jgi:hypothetical protein
MAIERCDKCGKAFLSQSEVDRHKMYEHPVPVLTFEEKKGSGADSSRDNSNNNTNMEDLQKMASDAITTGRTTHTNDTTPIGGTPMRKVSSRTFRV